MTRQQFFNSVRYLHLKPVVADGRIHFSNGGSALREALDDMPELEAELILREAVLNADVMDAVKERACIRWAEGYSDKLYMAVLCNIIPTGEIAELYEDGHPILKPKTDWDTELRPYLQPVQNGTG